MTMLVIMYDTFSGVAANDPITYAEWFRDRVFSFLAGLCSQLRKYGGRDDPRGLGSGAGGDQGYSGRRLRACRSS
eukprot:17670-Eustigmatos_ZCMA.PRE.1